MPIHAGTTEADAVMAFDLAVAHGADVISNSWGIGSPSSLIQAAIEDALAAGVTVVFAAGNGPDRPPWTYDTMFPCTMTETTAVICVGASSPTDEYKGAASSDGDYMWGSSYVGPGPDVVAPGPWSYTTDRRGSEGYNADSAQTGVSADYCHDFGGTSSSAPKVAGVAALLLSRDPTLTPQEVKDIIRDTARDIDETGADDRTGAGRVDAEAAMREVLIPPPLDVRQFKARPGTVKRIGKKIKVQLKVRNMGTDSYTVYAPDLITEGTASVRLLSGPRYTSKYLGTRKKKKNAKFKWVFEAESSGTVMFKGVCTADGYSPAPEASSNQVVVR